MNSLNRDTMMPKRKPFAFSFPPMVFSRISSVIFSVSLCLCGEMSSVLGNGQARDHGEFRMPISAKTERNARNAPKRRMIQVIIFVFLSRHSGVGGGLIFGCRSRKAVVQAL